MSTKGEKEIVKKVFPMKKMMDIMPHMCYNTMNHNGNFMQTCLISTAFIIGGAVVAKKQRDNHPRSPWNWVGKIFGTLVLVGFLTALIFACIFAVYIKTDLAEQVDFSVEGFALDQTSVIYYQDRKTGQWQELRKLYEKENRVWVGLEDIPLNLKNACIAIEDRRFEEHQGVDWLRTIRASLNMFSGNRIYGASTITQQLIKNLTHEDEVTVRRKLVEIFRALEFEKKYSKDDILEWYLNIIPLGQRCYGVQAAAMVYFGKDVEDLTLAESASLIGITNNPSMYDPYINPEANKERQIDILYTMLEQGYISETQYEQAKNEELVLVNRSAESSGGADYFSYFEDQVINEVVYDLMEKTGYEYAVTLRMLQTGGYQIYCTIDPEVQEKVDAVYEDLSNLPDTASSQQLQSAIVITDNETGDVVAMAGGVGEKKGSLIQNRATQSYFQPGSIIKPISVYAPALEQGLIHPATVMDDTPYQFTEYDCWPYNMDREYHGLVSVREAVSRSLNTVPVKLVAELGPEACFDFAKDNMGLSSLVKERITSSGTVLSDVGLAPLALGALNGGGVTVKNMTAAYTAFANNGLLREARTYTRVLDSQGKVVLDNTQDNSVAMSGKTAWYSTDMMMDVVQNGTGTGAQISKMAVAGKTGTTDDNKDRWFAGYTPYYTAVVWCGYDYPEEMILTDSTENPAVTLWQKTMSRIHAGLAPAEFTKPTDVVTASYCRDSGLLATEACRKDIRGDRTVSGQLSLEDVPTEYCTCHVMAELCGDHIANEFCSQVPGNKLEKVGLIQVDRVFPISGIVVEDQSYVEDSGTVEPGWYTAAAPEVDPVSLPCYEHSEEDVPKEEEDTTENEESSENWGDLLEEWLSQ